MYYIIKCDISKSVIIFVWVWNNKNKNTLKKQFEIKIKLWLIYIKKRWKTDYLFNQNNKIKL